MRMFRYGNTMLRLRRRKFERDTHAPNITMNDSGYTRMQVFKTSGNIAHLYRLFQTPQQERTIRLRTNDFRKAFRIKRDVYPGLPIGEERGDERNHVSRIRSDSNEGKDISMMKLSLDDDLSSDHLRGTCSVMIRCLQVSLTFMRLDARFSSSSDGLRRARIKTSSL